jgi:asparagine synthase (glutamine-hydrolysing)
LLKIQDTNKQNIKQWENINSFNTLIFTINKTDILHIHEDKNSITLFYGFLDQDYNENVAGFISKILNEKGANGLNECYGSFIVIHYDFDSKSFILANDALGDFSLHYCKKEDGCIHLSELPESLLTRTNCEVNTDRLIQYFAMTKPQINAGFYQQIKQLDGGQYLLVDSKISRLNYYNPPEIVNYKSTSVDHLSEQFKSLMQSVIAYQTRGEKRIGVMMSGGLDSTFVAANALKTGKSVSTFSYVFPNMPETNETLWIDSMRHMGFDMHTFVGESSYWPLKSPWYVSLNAPIANQYRHLKDVIYQQAKHKEIKFLLTGVYADHLYTGYIYWLVDQIKRKPFKAIASMYSTFSKHGIKESLRQISPAKWSSQPKSKNRFLNKKSSQRFLEIQKNQTKYKHPHPQQFALVYGTSTAQSVWLDHEHAYRHNVYIRHPFRDRRVVEFLMSLPAWVLGTNDIKKGLVKHASKDLLPDSIIRRTKTTTLTPLYIEGVLKKEFHRVKALLASSECQWQEYVDQELVTRLLNNPAVIKQDAELMILWQCICFELWQKRLRTI